MEPIDESKNLDNKKPSLAADHFMDSLKRKMPRTGKAAQKNIEWLKANMPPYFFITMKDETQALSNLAWSLDQVEEQSQVNLIDQPKKLILARLDKPGSLYETLASLRTRPISYAEMNHSLTRLPEAGAHLEIQRYEFDLKSGDQLEEARGAKMPPGLQGTVSQAFKKRYPDCETKLVLPLLRLIRANNPAYVKVSPPERIARVIWLYLQAEQNEGMYVDLDDPPRPDGGQEARLLFSAFNPPQTGFLAQAIEILQRLDVGVRRCYCLGVNSGDHSVMLSTFYIVARDGRPIHRQSELFKEIKAELYNTRIMSPACPIYDGFVCQQIMSGYEASLVNAFIAFCHTSLAHAQPDRFDFEEVKNAFKAHQGLTLNLIDLFRRRFDPDMGGSDEEWQAALAKVKAEIESYNTGHRNLDEIRKTVFRTCLLFIRHTLKTNFFVSEKQALGFRLNPAYLEELEPQFTAGLPGERPFRITFFFTREGFGYHIGFSDIARGGWRTVISAGDDEYEANAESLFKETYVLAHTQHLKNKDIYEGGSKMVLILDARDCLSLLETTQTLYGLQEKTLNAFLDLFITKEGRAVDPRVKDYYADDEPVELGPDENLHDAMIENIARQSVKRGYVLGAGLISSKTVGINHKAYGVTSRGVVTTAMIAMSEIGIDPEKQPFTVRFTGGPGGDVAGNAMRLLIDHHPLARITGIVDGPGLLCDPQGIDPEELRRLTLEEDVAAFNPEKLGPGAFLAYRFQRRREDLRELHRKLVRTEEGLEEQWITADEYQRHAQHLTFSLASDLFLPCGGRPETIDEENWTRIFPAEGGPTAKLIVEGANSFITPQARLQLQEKGVVIIRDSSANKCGVISSSYEIIANLLMSDKEFTTHKDEYVRDVLAILNRRATEETNLILKRRRESEGRIPYTEISAGISREINEHYANLFNLFQDNPQLGTQPLYKQVMLNHMPAFIGTHRKYASRLEGMPQKVKCAILASEIASMIVYQGGWEGDLGARVSAYLDSRLPVK